MRPELIPPGAPKRVESTAARRDVGSTAAKINLHGIFFAAKENPEMAAAAYGEKMARLAGNARPGHRNL